MGVSSAEPLPPADEAATQLVEFASWPLKNQDPQGARSAVVLGVQLNLLATWYVFLMHQGL